MFKCLCCRGGRQKREKVSGSKSHKFSPENVQTAADAQASDPNASDRFLRKKLDDDRADRFDGPSSQRQASNIGSGGKGPAAPVRKQVAPPPPPPPLPVVGVKQQVNQPVDPDEDYAEDPAAYIVEEVLSVRVEQQYTVDQPRPPAPPQPLSAPKSSSSGSSSEEEEEEEKVEQRPPPPPPPLLMQKSHHQPKDHLHGSTVFQSDENETTIVDSDYSDYEDDEVDNRLRQAAESGHAARTTATLSVILPRRRSDRDEDDEEHELKAAAERLSTFLLAEEGDNDDGSGANFGWQTLPNSLRSRGGHLTHHHQPPLLETLVEEEPIAMIAPQPDGIETGDYEEEDAVPVPSPSSPTPSQQQRQQQLKTDDDPFLARESLLALDQALAVFELAAIYDEPSDFAPHSHAAVNGFDEAFVEEEIIQTSPRNS